VIRKVAVLWISLSNLVFAGIVLRHLAEERSLHGLLDTPMPWEKYSLPILIVVILLTGIVLEFFDSKLAFFVNAGFFLLVAAYAVDILVHTSQEPEGRIFGWLLGIPALLVLVVDVLLYWGKTRRGAASGRSAAA
jgi:hypothetical protein